MAFQAKLEHGDPLKLDYTPGADVAAGDVVVVGELPLIATQNITSGRLGALYCGGGAYIVAKEAPLAITGGALLYWDDTNNRVTTTASTNKKWGYAGPAGGASADTTIYAFHKPGG